MSNKRDLILSSALQLFSEEGFHATSTIKIAKHAGVSEGLIFRYFQNKIGLGKALIDHCNEYLIQTFDPLRHNDDPKAIIQAIIELPFNITLVDLKYWTLLYKLRWELDASIKTFGHAKDILDQVFGKLRYRDPETESQFLIHHLDAMIVSRIRHEEQDVEHLKRFLKRKYYLE